MDGILVASEQNRLISRTQSKPRRIYSGSIENTTYAKNGFVATGRWIEGQGIDMGSMSRSSGMQRDKVTSTCVSYGGMTQ